MQIFGGLVMIIAGALVVAKANWIMNNFGRIGFFDKYLGTEGGSRLGYKLIGIVVIFFGILIMTNMVGGFFLWVFSPLLKHNVIPQGM